MNNTLKLITAGVMAATISACTTTDFTSSTSSTLDAVTPDVTLQEFVTKRYVAIRQEAAIGGGENIDALAQLLGEQNSKQLAQQMQQNFDTIFVNVQQPEDILARIKETSEYPRG